MICPKCKTKYYSKTHCPNCGLDAFSLNKGKRVPVKTSYRYLNRVTILAFMVVILLGVIYIKYAAKMERGNGENISLKKVSLIKVKRGDAPGSDAPAPSPAAGAVSEEAAELSKLNKLGVDAYNKKEYDRAFIYFYQAYAIDNQNPAIKTNLHNTLLSKGHEQLSEKLFDDAIDTLTKGLKYVDDDFNTHQGLGLAYSGKGDNEAALTHLLRAYELNPADDRLKYYIARVYTGMGENEKAREFMERIEKKGYFSLDISFFDMVTNANQAEVKGKVETKSSNFNVYYDGLKDPVAGNLVSLILEEAYYSVGSELGYYPDEKVTAILYTNEQFSEEINHPGWSDGLFDGKIKLPAGGLKNRSQKLQEVLTHEYTHAVIFYKIRANCPSWLNEGLAQILSDKPYPPEQIVAAIARLNRLPAISDLERSFINMSAKDALIAYSISMLFTKNLIDSNGMGSVRDLLDALAKGDKVKDAFYKTYYYDLDDRYQKFITTLKSKYK